MKVLFSVVLFATGTGAGAWWGLANPEANLFGEQRKTVRYDWTLGSNPPCIIDQAGYLVPEFFPVITIHGYGADNHKFAEKMVESLKALPNQPPEYRIRVMDQD